MDNFGGFPAIHSEVFRTEKGTPYLKGPGVVLIAMPRVNLDGVQPFLDGFDEELEFEDYLDDAAPLEPAETLVKFAGQLCYLSFAPGRTWNKDAQKYLDNLKSSGHGSPLEHPKFTFLLYGVDRSFTHELVRHRVGVAFSQVSQRYVSGKTLRFVERQEYPLSPDLHRFFEDWIDAAVEEYDRRAEALMEMQEGGTELMQGEKKRDLRKKVNQAARGCLPNETEAPIVFSGNVRALRHICEMRANEGADVQIRRVAVHVHEILMKVAPMLFKDHEIVQLKDGTQAVQTAWRKV